MFTPGSSSAKTAAAAVSMSAFTGENTDVTATEETPARPISEATRLSSSMSRGDISRPVELVTAAAHIGMTAQRPAETVRPIRHGGNGQGSR